MKRRTQALWAPRYLGATLVPLGQIESERFDIESSSSVGPRQHRVRRSVLILAVLMVAAAALFAM